MKAGQTRASGMTVAEEVIRDEAERAEDIAALEMPEERERRFRTPGFSRMRTEWSTADRPVIQHALDVVDGRILQTFGDAFQVMSELFDIVRTAETNPDGSVRLDRFGFPVWKKLPSGAWDEDFSRLTTKQRENFLYQITTRIFDWEQRAANVWGEAMFAKAAWEERFSIGFDAPMAGTVDDRRDAGNLAAREERYFAIFTSLYSRRADAIVRSMTLLGQRLRDTIST